MGCYRGSLGDKNVERNVDNGRLVCEVFEGIKDFICQGYLCNVFELRIVVVGQLGLQYQLWLIIVRIINMKFFVLYLDNGCWLFWVEELVVISKRVLLLG